MPRSSREQAGENRRRILAAAGGLFRSRGYDAVTIADVMKAAGMTQGGFYKHFSSKEALAREAWAAAFEVAATLWRQSGGEAGPQVSTVLDAYFAPRPPEQTCPMAAHCGDASRAEDAGELRAAFRDGAERLFDTLHDLSRGGMSEDQVNVVFAAMVGASVLRRAVGDAAWITAVQKSIMAAAA